MCGIVGYIGKKDAVPIIISGLKRLEYRGYDCLSPDTLVQLADGRIKTVQEIELNSLLSSINFQDFSIDKGRITMKGKKKKKVVYKIRTPAFEIKSSKDHRFFTYQDGKIIEKKAAELKSGDFLVAQKRIPIKGRSQKLPQIKDTIYYQLTPRGIKIAQQIREKKHLSYSSIERKVGVSYRYAKDYLEGKRATTEENWQKLLSLFEIDSQPFLKKFAKRKICSHSFRNIFTGSHLTPELSQIIGYITGDGSRIDSNKDTKIKIEDDKETLEVYRGLFKKIGINTKLLKHRHKNCWQIRVYSASFGKLLNKIAPGILDSSSTREVPEIIQKAPLSCGAGFLRGIFDAEGTVGKRKRDGVCFCVENEKLLRQIQLLLLRFGLVFHLHFSNVDNRFDRIAIYSFDTLREFSNFVNFSSPRKRKSLERLISIKTPKRKTKGKSLRNSPVFWSKIKQIEISSSTHLMYDLSVPDTQNFIANGLIVHNSAGIVVKKKSNNFECIKSIGRLDSLIKKIPPGLKGNESLGHVRWATTGKVNEANAHPHWDCKKEIFVVHNGIIENYKELKDKLIEEGHKFSSETDTEILCHLIEKYFQGNLEEATRKALKEVKGTYGIAVISKKDPQKIVAARLSSPLILGINNNEFLVASDPAAIITRTRQIINLDDNEIAVLKPNNFFILKEKPVQTIEWTPEEAEKGGYPHFMLKEIMEQPESLENSKRGRLIPEEGMAKLGGLEEVKEKLRKIKRLILVACGTAFHAGLVGEYMLEEYARIPVEVEVASEFRYKKPILNKDTAVLAISQSGETADTLAAVREAKEKGILTLGIVNCVGSSVARETTAGVYNHAGPEIGVASTKAFTSQLEVLALLTLFLGRQREMSLVIGQRIAKEISKIPDLVREVLKNSPRIENLAKKYKDFNNFLFLGRKYNFPIALEGALKLKEIAYVNAQGYGAGEMKHGPLALIDKNFPTFAICPSDSVYDKMVSNIEEIKARKGKVIILATEGDEKIQELADDIIYIPKTLEMLTPILSVIPLQFFAYYVGVFRGCDVDKPKNLAKSVTCE